MNFNEIPGYREWARQPVGADLSALGGYSAIRIILLKFIICQSAVLRPASLSLAVEQTTCIAKNFVSAHMAVAVFRHQAVNNFIDFAQLVLVRCAC